MLRPHGRSAVSIRRDKQLPGKLRRLPFLRPHTIQSGSVLGSVADLQIRTEPNKRAQRMHLLVSPYVTLVWRPLHTFGTWKRHLRAEDLWNDRGVQIYLGLWGSNSAFKKQKAESLIPALRSIILAGRRANLYAEVSRGHHGLREMSYHHKERHVRVVGKLQCDDLLDVYAQVQVRTHLDGQLAETKWQQAPLHDSEDIAIRLCCFWIIKCGFRNPYHFARFNKALALLW